jgi:hypothetical protein
MGSGSKYHILSRDGVDCGGVADHLSGGARAYWLPYAAVDDVDLAIAVAGGEARGFRLAAKTSRESVASVCWRLRPAQCSLS